MDVDEVPAISETCIGDADQLMEGSCPSCSCAIQLLINRNTQSARMLFSDPQKLSVQQMQSHEPLEVLEEESSFEYYNNSTKRPKLYAGKKAPSGKKRFRWVGNAELNEKFERAVRILSSDYTRFQDGIALSRLLY